MRNVFMHLGFAFLAMLCQSRLAAKAQNADNTKAGKMNASCYPTARISPASGHNFRASAAAAPAKAASFSARKSRP